MVPSIFGENLFDEFWNDPFDMDRMLPRGRDPLYGKHSKNLMKTDVRETEGSYELDVDLPGFKKDEVNVELNNGYLTIEAAKSLDKDDADKQGRYIRQVWSRRISVQSSKTASCSSLSRRAPRSSCRRRRRSRSSE